MGLKILWHTWRHGNKKQYPSSYLIFVYFCCTRINRLLLRSHHFFSVVIFRRMHLCGNQEYFLACIAAFHCVCIKIICNHCFLLLPSPNKYLFIYQTFINISLPVLPNSQHRQLLINSRFRGAAPLTKLIRGPSLYKVKLYMLYKIRPTSPTRRLATQQVGVRPI